ncbi:NADH-quinone oxidoreductase subunit B family protein [Methanococcus maripaludis]|jgi:energy-converting hydrogenase B subunit M|uniref:Energy conserving hydrogenase B small subunit n=3 Tax=Methanococcus maripaludis TaxID=39152 RepID=Q6LWT4_METMP|nr:NADH-quinone oxidoreductase subunit B family protein [Methanococcus maripaludis]MDK2929058.1 energy-converting hydrogenase subunit [Methanococcus sp.]MBA2847522.1 energy-converting hydrogenase B subunit M [Methanococcus maripaludis]MBA2849973.1 energy-converting hydrogenase B subunit M [Methanococcus maripaludis]MBB6067376.1 energy-converting hydrogenase B subunit M [Methanococcus maripaludis]MBG0769220.1 NADH-quinone oxidoreductase subunit B family protein [Methanococcus maripaludis]
MLKELSRKKNIHVMLVYTGGCNGCDIEVVNCVLSPFYDAEQYNVFLTWNPREADVLVVTGCVTKAVSASLKKIYDEIPEPKAVVAAGACALMGGVYNNIGADLGTSTFIDGPVENIIPVDVKVPGCPPRPEDVITGIVKALPKILNG